MIVLESFKVRYRFLQYNYKKTEKYHDICLLQMTVCFPPPTRTKKKDKKEEEEVKEVKKQRVIDDTGRHKPFGKTAWAPADDVYILRYYPRKLHRAGDAVELLQAYSRLDFTPKHQPVFMDLQLDMKLEKKKKVDSFVSTVHLPHPFKAEMNKVLVFTEDPEQARVAQENGAVIVGGKELVQQILDDDISADFYIAVPEILPKLMPLKNKLRKKFPKSKRGSVGVNIPKMLDLFKMGHEYIVEDNCYVRTQIATVRSSREPSSAAKPVKRFGSAPTTCYRKLQTRRQRSDFTKSYYME
uniref:Large ribosomal subunit protein uL1m n=1 Tax=Neogobius melanostomus TaxID=47308 RepID=A0A8C6U449_9GOBI